MKKKTCFKIQKNLTVDTMKALSKNIPIKLFVESFIESFEIETIADKTKFSVENVDEFLTEFNVALQNLITVVDSYSTELTVIKLKLYAELKTAIIENYELNRKVYTLPSTTTTPSKSRGFTENSALNDFETLKLNLDKSKPVDMLVNIRSSICFYREQNLKLKKVISKLKPKIKL